MAFHLGNMPPLPTPPGHQEAERYERFKALTLSEHANIWRKTFSFYIGTFKTSEEDRAKATEQKRRVKELKDQMVEAGKLAQLPDDEKVILQRMLRDRLVSLKDALVQFREGFEAGKSAPSVFEQNEDSKDGPQQSEKDASKSNSKLK